MKRDTWFGRDRALLTVFISPLDRVWSAKAIAIGVGAIDYLLTDAFGGALFLSVLSGVFDYRTGIKASRLLNQVDPLAAQRAWLAKITGFFLSVLIRALEYYIKGQGFFDTHGALATAIALSLFAVDLQTTAHYREQMGAPPIPVLGRVLKWIQDFASSKVSASPPALPANTGNPTGTSTGDPR